MLDAVVIGGGFYGTVLAIYLAEKRGLRRIVLLERGQALMERASYNNQARIHNGYHYPRSFTTAYRSRVNLPVFLRDFPFAAHLDFTKLYAIARHNSKVSSQQFERFCQQIGAKLARASGQYRALFDPYFVEAVYEVQEYAFNAAALREWAEEHLAKLGIEVVYGAHVTEVQGAGLDRLLIAARQEGGEAKIYEARYVLNCTYSGLNQIGGDAKPARAMLKHEITEMALVRMPQGLENVGVTVMDGPFFSVMPFPARKLHTLSHVRYTPHREWMDAEGDLPYAHLDHYGRETRFDRMVRDASRFMPALAQAQYADSLFEVKTVLLKNETDDGRPILFERSRVNPNLFSVLGGKIDNIYDVLKKFDEVEFVAA